MIGGEAELWAGGWLTQKNEEWHATPLDANYPITICQTWSEAAKYLAKCSPPLFDPFTRNLRGE
jgi:hypothetical protein